MNEMNKPTEQTEVNSANTSGVARRRMILASLGKGSAVVGAVSVPMQSLAAIGTLSVNVVDGKRCTMSGTMSGVHSTETIKATCEGWNPDYYSDITKWPNYSTLNTTGQNAINGGTGIFDKNTSFFTLFGSGTNDRLIKILKRNAGTQDEASWIAAVLNGTTGSRAVNTNFPYTAAQVIGFYQTGGNTASNALIFFQRFMQTKAA